MCDDLVELGEYLGFEQSKTFLSSIIVMIK